MVDKIFLKRYEILLLFVLVLNAIVGVGSEHYTVFALLRPMVFFVSLSMIIAWALMIRNKDLSNFELVVALFSVGVVLQIGFALVLFAGSLTESFFGVSVVQLPFIFICIVIFVWLLLIVIKSIKQEKKKPSLRKTDLIVLICVFLLLIFLMLYYLFLSV